jgi:uncharacterized protein YfaT (DUF1175 family)
MPDLIAHRSIQPIAYQLRDARLPADGYGTTEVTIDTKAAPRLSVQPKNSLRVGEIRRHRDHWVATLRAGVQPGAARIRIEAESATAVDVPFELTGYYGDREHDGTPDALRLDSDQDQAAFRRWFAFLAEAQFYQEPGARPKEINDCAALIRYAYREALHAHDSAWVRDAHLPLVLAMDSVQKYQYPYTLLGAALFRNTAGEFRSSDLGGVGNSSNGSGGGAFSQFADAHTLQRFNTYFVSRDLSRAMPGDLLFYKQDFGDMPFHSMIYLGRSVVHDDGQAYLLYHTGPDTASGDPGEIRRPSVAELMRHPDTRWRPYPGNPTFLGVYRWNILHNNMLTSQRDPLATAEYGQR